VAGGPSQDKTKMTYGMDSDKNNDNQCVHVCVYYKMTEGKE